MRYFLVVLSLSLCPLGPAVAQVSIQIGLPNVSIGINQPIYPRMVAIPGYPVYYAPNGNSNYFFYDGMYWVYEGDNWYASSWFNGPWAVVAPQAVPVFILRVPVRYYRQPPAYFHGWSASAPPRWGEHWGYDWERQRSGWAKWNHGNAPRPAPLPVYQMQYSGNRYPHQEQQPTLHSQNYRYQPRDATVQQAYKAHGIQGGPPPSQPTSRPSPQAGPGVTASTGQPGHPSNQGNGPKDKGSKDKGEGSEQKGNPGQAKGGGHDRDK